MTPTIALIAVSLISAGLCVAVGIMQWRITALKADATYARFKAEKQTEHYEELLTEARNEAKTEYDLRRQAERNLAEANDELDTWRARAMKAENALSKFSRQRDPKTGQFYSAKAKPSTLIETGGPTSQQKPHTLRHGMTVKDPTPEQAKEIFDEAQRLGIEFFGDPMPNEQYTWIWFEASNPAWATIGTCTDRTWPFTKFVTFNEFLAHMRGEYHATTAFNKMMGDPMSQLDGLTVRKLCDEVKENASAGI